MVFRDKAKFGLEIRLAPAGPGRFSAAYFKILGSDNPDSTICHLAVRLVHSGPMDAIYYDGITPGVRLLPNNKKPIAQPRVRMLITPADTAIIISATAAQALKELGIPSPGVTPGALMYAD